MIGNKILIVTGLSGAGMSSALKSLEDMGYEVFDNFPPALIDPLLADTKAEDRPLAIAIDSRARGFDPAALLDMAARVRARLLFVTADDAVLQKRFTETRRRHPMAQDRPVAAGIKKEQEMLHALRRESDVTIDTSDLSVHDLKRMLEGHFGLTERKMTVSLMSFGFRFGIPREADILLDIRFLNNPHWVADLKPLTGLNTAVGAYIEKDKDFAPFCARFKNMLEPLLPRYAAEGKSYLTVALGCTGGRHRSVYTVEKLKPWLEGQGFAVNVIHRDIDR
jgi:UPF0042 nucleotide-binding protein